MNTIIDLNKIYPIPFANGYALQEYAVAEDGLMKAAQSCFTHWYIDGSLDEESLDKWNPDRLASLKNQIQEWNIKPIFHGNYKVPLASDVPLLRKAAIQYVMQEIDVASHFQCPLVIHGGAIVEPRLINKAKKKALENYVESINILMDYGKNKQVDIYLENLSNYKHYKPFHYIFTHLEEIDYVIRNIPEAKLFLDVGHANIGEGNPAQLIRHFHKYIVAMSFSNNDGNTDQHLRLTKGTINFEEIVATILEVNWKGLIAFETRGISPTHTLNDLYRIYRKVTNHTLTDQVAA